MKCYLVNSGGNFYLTAEEPRVYPNSSYLNRDWHDHEGRGSHSICAGGIMRLLGISKEQLPNPGEYFELRVSIVGELD